MIRNKKKIDFLYHWTYRYNNTKIEIYPRLYNKFDFDIFENDRIIVRVNEGGIKKYGFKIYFKLKKIENFYDVEMKRQQKNIKKTEKENRLREMQSILTELNSFIENHGK